MLHSEFDENDTGLMSIKQAVAGARVTNQLLTKYGKITPKLPLAVPHTLYFGPGGVGKTRRVEEAVKIMGCSKEAGNFITLSPDCGKNIQDVVDILQSSLSWDGYLCNHGKTCHCDCPSHDHYIVDPINPRSAIKPQAVFLDEIHVLSKDVQEKLGLILLDFKYEYIGHGGVQTAYFPKFTFFGATTKPGDLIKPLRTRFGNKINVGYYTDEEMLKIAKTMFNARGLNVEPGAMEIIARMSQGIARECENHVSGLYNSWIYQLETGQTSSKNVITKDVAKNYVKFQKFTEDGLSFDQIRVLKYLKTFVKGLKRTGVGVARMCAAIGMDELRFADEIEPRLVYRGFITQGGRGREITEQGLKYLNEKAAHLTSVS